MFWLDGETVFGWVNVVGSVSFWGLFCFVFFGVSAGFLLSRSGVAERWHILFILLLGLVGVYVFIGSTQPESDFLLHYDAARHLHEVGVMDGLRSLTDMYYLKAPLLEVLHSVVFGVFGAGFVQAESLQRLFYLLLPLGVYLVGRELWSGEVGFHAALLTLATPSILQQNYMLMQDGPVTFFTVFTAYLFLKSFRDWRYAVAAVLSAAATVLTKNNGLVFVAAVLGGAALLHVFRGGSVRREATVTVYLALAVVVVVVLAFVLLPGFWDTIYTRAVRLLPSLWERVFSGVVLPTSILFQVGLAQALLAVYAIKVAWKHRDRKLFFLAAWIILPLLVLVGLRTRYLMPMFPALSLLVAWGVSWLGVRERRFVVYSAVAVMFALTAYASPQVADEYVFRNIMYGAKGADAAGVREVGVYLDFVHPWLREAPLVSGVDYYFGGDVRYLCCDDRPARGSSARNKYVIPGRYLGRNYSAAELDAVLAENYSLAGEWSGGSFYHHDPYYVKLYVLGSGKSGPTGAVLYASNVDPKGNIYFDFWENMETKAEIQYYSVGPLRLKSHYGVYMEDWLGERQVFVKPPDVGQMNATYWVDVPENTSLSFSISLRPDTWHYLKGDGVRFRVLVDGDVLLDRYLDSKHNKDEWGLFHYKYPLSRYWGRNVTFVFQSFSGPGDDSMWDTAGFGDPAVVWG